MKVLVVSDVPIASGYHYQILDSLLSSFPRVKWDNEPVLRMSQSEAKKAKPEQWVPRIDEVRKLAKGYDKVLVCGSIAAATWFGSEKGVPVTKIRGRSYEHNGKHSLVTFMPSTCLKDPEFFKDLSFDVCKLIENDGQMPQPQIEIHLIERRADLKMLNDLKGASFLGSDIETTGLDLYKGYLPHIEPTILGAGFCAIDEDDSGYALVIPQDLIGREVYKFLTTYKGTFVFHNLKFDIQHLWHKFGRFNFHSVADTMLMGWALDERPFNRYRHLGLDLLQRLYFDAPPKSVSMKDWLEEYFRKDVGEEARQAYIRDLCEHHPEKARTYWRQATSPADHEWRGKKVGRDISIETVAPFIPLPKNLQPAPDADRKGEMWEAMMRYMGEDCYYTARLYPILKREALDE